MDPESRKEIAKNSRVLADFPCVTEKKLVDECYNRTSYDKEACKLPISNYQSCKNFWNVVEKLRRVQGIRPTKPDAEERARIKTYYQEHKKLPKFPLEADVS